MKDETQAALKPLKKDKEALVRAPDLPGCFAADLTPNELLIYHARLEKLVRDRTAKLEKANTELQSEIAGRRRVEDALKKSEAQLRKIIDLVPHLIFVKDRDGRFLLINRAFAEHYGATPDELTGRYHAEVHPDADEVWQMLSDDREVMTNDEIKVIAEESFTNHEGRKLLLHVTKVPFHTIDDNADAVLGVAIDITERKRTEMALKKSEASLREAQSVAHMGSWSWDAGTSVMTWSEELYKIMGRDPGLPLPRPDEWGSVFSPECWEVYWKRVKHTQRTGEPLETELKFQRSDGVTRWVFIKAEVQYDSDGALNRMHGTSQDITAHKEAEEALRSSEQNLVAIMESTNDLIWSVDSVHFRLLTFNTAYKKFFSSDKNIEIVPGMSLEERLSPESAELWKKVYKRALKEESFPTEMKIVEGSRTLLISANQLFRSGRLYAISLFGKDITEKMKAEDALRLAHEELEANYRRLNDSACALKDAINEKNLELAERRRIESELRSLTVRLENVREEERTSIARELHDELGQNLTALRFDVSNLRRIKTERGDQCNEVFDSMMGLLDSMIYSVHKISSELRPRILDDLGFIEAVKWFVDEFTKRTGIRCSYRFPQDSPELDRKLSTTLFRICQEALTNVARHSMASQVSIALKGKNGIIEMTVKDNGIGISGEKACTPLSLGIVGIRERVHLLGGEVNIKGSKNKGTTIRVLLPLPSDGSEVK